MHAPPPCRPLHLHISYEQLHVHMHTRAHTCTHTCPGSLMAARLWRPDGSPVLAAAVGRRNGTGEWTPHQGLGLPVLSQARGRLTLQEPSMRPSPSLRHLASESGNDAACISCCSAYHPGRQGRHRLVGGTQDGAPPGRSQPCTGGRPSRGEGRGGGEPLPWAREDAGRWGSGVSVPRRPASHTGPAHTHMHGGTHLAWRSVCPRV